VGATLVAHSDKRRLKSPPQVLKLLASAVEQANCVSLITVIISQMLHTEDAEANQKIEMRGSF
jgi:hypothetical protein